jgi:hypothetical protein
MEGHEERAQELEYELADMEKSQDDLDDGIHAAKDDWEAKKRDASVPGAGTGEETEDGEQDTEATGEGAPEVEDEDS